MNAPEIQDREKIRKDRAKKAVALAMKSRWEDAVAINQVIVRDFPDDLEAYNRLGKALSELGRNRESIDAFKRALELSPNNTIARKNLDRLMRLGDEEGQPGARSSASPQVFIEESGKAGLTSLVNLASPRVLLKLAPGHPVQLHLEGSGALKVTSPTGEYVGQVEPRISSRLSKLMRGGNRYEANVTSASERELTIIIRETYKDPSQVGIVSFPSKGGAERRVYTPASVISYELGDEEAEEPERLDVKDWSDDDTEPGDDEAFTPVLHRIINADGDEVSDDEY